MALEVRRVDVETGELLMPWTTFPSQSAAAQTFTSHGLHGMAISRLVRGLEPHWNGFEARRCGDRDGDAAADDTDDKAGARTHPSPEVPRVTGAGFANAQAQACARTVEVRCSVERARTRGRLTGATSRTNQIAPHSVRGDPSLSTFGVPGATH